VTFDEALARLEAAGLWEEMLSFVEMEPLPAGALLFQDVTIADANPVQLGGDSSGGAYVQLSDGSVALMSSEGKVAILGPSLKAALAHGVGTGGLFDALRFTGLPDVGEARARWLAVRAQWKMPDPLRDPAALEIAEVLDLSLPKDPFTSLYLAVQTTPPDLVRMGGDPFRRFGT
jgi:hypothetical protein